MLKSPCTATFLKKVESWIIKNGTVNNLTIYFQFVKLCDKQNVIIFISILLFSTNKFLWWYIFVSHKTFLLNCVNFFSPKNLGRSNKTKAHESKGYQYPLWYWAVIYCQSELILVIIRAWQGVTEALSGMCSLMWRMKLCGI